VYWKCKSMKYNITDLTSKNNSFVIRLKMQNFTVAVAKDYMLTNQVRRTKKFHKPNTEINQNLNRLKTKILCCSNNKNVAAKTKNLYLNLRLSQHKCLRVNSVLECDTVLFGQWFQLF
jgi:hypothetical protein